MKALWLVIILLVGLTAGGYKDAGAIDYRWFGENDEGFFFYDVDSITRPSKEIVQVWVKEDFSGPGRRVMSRALGQRYDNLDHSITQEELNCKDKAFRRLSLTLYSRDGSVLSSSKSLTEGFESIQPGSVNEDLYNAVCEQEKK